MPYVEPGDQQLNGINVHVDGEEMLFNNEKELHPSAIHSDAQKRKKIV